MADISLCTFSGEDDVCLTCRRKIEKPSDMQSYAEFKPWRKGECEYRLQVDTKQSLREAEYEEKANYYQDNHM